MEINYSIVCDIGKCRDENQDSVLAETGAEWGLFAVADGMGGHSEGARASQEVINALHGWASQNSEELAYYDIPRLFSEFRKLLGEANDRIFSETPEGEICGSTAVVLMIVKDYYILLSAGDSRCYEVKKNLFKKRLEQITNDEIWEDGRKKGKLTNAVGIRTPLRCNITSGEIEKKHIFLMCTDGVYKYCKEYELLSLIKDRKDGAFGELGQEIKELVYQNGARDNLSAIAISVTK